MMWVSLRTERIWHAGGSLLEGSGLRLEGEAAGLIARRAR